MIQINSKDVLIRLANPTALDRDKEAQIKLKMSIKGIDCNDSHAIFWNGKHAQLYDINSIKLYERFECKATVIALAHEDPGDELSVIMYMGIENRLDVAKINTEKK